MSHKKVLMATSNHWTSTFRVGSHHLARGFVEAGWDVAFVSAPVSPVHLLGGVNQELNERLAIYRSGGIYDLDDHLWTYVPGALLTPHNKPVLRSEWVHRNWAKLTRPNILSKVCNAGFNKVDLLYIDNVLQSFWLDKIRYKKSVFRIADKNTGFERSTLAMQNLEQELAAKVDAVAYTAKNLKDYINSMHPKSALHLPNGVNFKHFADGSKTPPPEYEEIPKPIAVYVGVMDVWFDCELLNRTAEELPNVSFVLIGSDELVRTRIKDLPNIYLLGRRPYSELPSYLYHADIGIIPFNVARYSDLVNTIHPLKLYEYLASGIPVVSVEWDELKSIGSPVILCRDARQFVRGIAEMASKSRGKDTYIQYAAKQDWSARVKALLDFMDNLGNSM